MLICDKAPQDILFKIFFVIYSQPTPFKGISAKWFQSKKLIMKKCRNLIKLILFLVFLTVITL